MSKCKRRRCSEFDVFDALIRPALSFWLTGASPPMRSLPPLFDINNLAAIRMEFPEVFASAPTVFELIASGAIDGLRIDHVDGLWHPRAYLEALPQRAASLVSSAADTNARSTCSSRNLGESEISAAGLADAWTTGYEFANHVTAVLVDQNRGRSSPTLLQIHRP